MGNMLTNMTVGNHSHNNGSASASAPTPSGLDALTGNAAATNTAEIKALKSDKEDTLVMDTKLKIIEILQVSE